MTSMTSARWILRTQVIRADGTKRSGRYCLQSHHGGLEPQPCVAILTDVIVEIQNSNEHSAGQGRFSGPPAEPKLGAEVNEELYDDYILDHYECPYHKGHIACPTCAHSEKNPLCGDQIRLELKLDDSGKVEEAFFNGKGCAISQAAASILCQHVEGKTLNELQSFQAPDMLRLLKVPLTATRQRCGLLGFKVLKTMMYARDQAATPYPTSKPEVTDESAVATSG